MEEACTIITNFPWLILSSSFTKYAYIVVRLLLSAWLLVFFVLPNTFWARFSPFSHTLIFDAGCKNYSEVVITCVFAIAICALYVRSSRLNDFSLRISVLTTSLLAAIIITALNWHSDQLLGDHAIMLIAAYSIGLFTALFINKPAITVGLLVVLSTAQAAYVLYYHYIGEHTFLSGTIQRAGGTGDSPASIYIFLIVSIPCALAAAVSSRNSLVTLIWMLCSAILFAALFLIYSRGAMIAVAVSTIWMLSRTQRWNKLIVSISLLLVVAVFIVSYIRTDGSINRASASRSVTGRILLWKRGETIFEQHWISGVGIGDLQIPLEVALPIGDKSASKFYAQPNNLILYWLDEMGIAGGLLFLLFCIAIRSIINNDCSSISTGIGAAWIAVFVAGLFDTVFGTPYRINANAFIGTLLGATILLPFKQTMRVSSDEIVEIVD